MKNLPLVSIIIPVYGVEKYIKKCAISLFEQTYSNIEYIFVNDATKDNSIIVLKEIIKQYPHLDERVVIFNHELNRGLSAARNTGIMHAKGDYLMHVDSDDYLELNAVEILVDKAVHSNADVVIADSYSVYSNSMEYNSNSFSSKDELIYRVLTKSAPPSIWGKLYSAKLYSSDKDTRSVEGINHGEDYATTPRLLYYANDIVRVDKPLYNYVQYNQGSYTKNISKTSVDSLLKADKKISDFFSEKVLEGHDMQKTLALAKLRTKTALLKGCSPYLMKYVRTFYCDIQKEYKSILPVTDRILLFLVELNMYRLASVYSSFGLYIKRKICLK